MIEQLRKLLEDVEKVTHETDVYTFDHLDPPSQQFFSWARADCANCAWTCEDGPEEDVRDAAFSHRCSTQAPYHDEIAQRLRAILDGDQTAPEIDWAEGK